MEHQQNLKLLCLVAMATLGVFLFPSSITSVQDRRTVIVYRASVSQSRCCTELQSG